MTERERELLNYLKDNPMISQAELATRMHITRSSVSVHISNLMKKGHIKGKGYVLSEAVEEVVVIGGANMDITGQFNQLENKEDSNPGKISMALGGVGRNIAENLAHLGINVSLLTAVGNDLYGHDIIDQCQDLGINMKLTKTNSNYNTSIYMQVLNEDGELNTAVNDMAITESITIEDILRSENTLNRAKAIVVDGNISEEVIAFLSETYGEKMFFEPVSKVKAMKIVDHINKIYCMTPNILEAQVLTNLSDEVDILNKFSELGLAFPIITLGKKGVLIKDHENKYYDSLPVDVKNVTGAGDALMAGLVYGYMKNFTKTDMVSCGLKLAQITLMTDKAVNINVKQLEI